MHNVWEIVNIGLDVIILGLVIVLSRLKKRDRREQESTERG